MSPHPRPAMAARSVRPLVLALALAWPGLSAWAQDISGPPMGYVLLSRLTEAQDKLRQLQDALAKEQAKAKAAQEAADRAGARATQAERAERAATEALAGKVTPEQLAALRNGRDSALADAETLRRELAQANDSLKRLKAAAAEQAAAAAELDKLRRQGRDQQATIATLRSQLASKDQALATARQLVTQPAPAVAAPLPSTRPAPAAATLGLPPDLTELSVPGCGLACPSFVLLPNPGTITLGAGIEALQVNFAHRFAMATTETTVGQWTAFIQDSGYRPVKTDTTTCNWNDGDYASNDRLPVSCVNTRDAEAYAAWFTQKYAAQLGLRIESVGLPSELEFEFAARGGRYTQPFLWPDNASNAEQCKHAHIDVCDGPAKPVAGRLQNGYKLYDMIGNVWEWTASPWRAQRSALPANGREALTGVSGLRSVRGASYFSSDGWLALSYRHRIYPGVRSYGTGFRLVARIAP